MNFKSIILFVATGFIFSCSNEKLQDGLINPPVTPPSGTVNPGNGNTGTNGNAAIIPNPSGDYFPRALNNSWNYYNGTDIKNFKITGIETINALTYYKINNTLIVENSLFKDSDILTHVRKDGVNYITRTFINKPEVMASAAGVLPVVVGSPSIVIQPFEYIFLKENMAVNDTYTETIPTVTKTGITTTVIQNGVPVPITNYTTTTSDAIYKITLVEKTDNVFVNGYNTTVLKIKTETVGQPGFRFTWYAKDIGIWKQTFIDASNVVTNYQNMTTFFIF